MAQYLLIEATRLQFDYIVANSKDSKDEFGTAISWRSCYAHLIKFTGRCLYVAYKAMVIISSLLESSSNFEYLAYKLGYEEYGVNILKVQEIRGYEQPTQIANAPSYIKGVINLRGAIVPIIDMRIKFGFEQVSYDQFTVVIILNVGRREIGMVVDGVSDVITLSQQQIKPAPEMGSTVRTEYLTGIGTIEERMLILVDIDKLMSSDDLGLVECITA